MRYQHLLLGAALLALSACSSPTAVLLESTDGPWNHYESRTLGFKMSVPKTVMTERGVTPVVIAEDYTTNHVTIGDTSVGQAWVMTVAKPVNGMDAELKRLFGQGCTISARLETGWEGTSKIELNGDGKSADQTACPGLMGNPVIFASEEGKLAYWNLGQGVQFTSDAQGSIVYDADMLRSFRFID